MVWRQLPKLVPAGSIPVSCSNRLSRLRKPFFFADGAKGRPPRHKRNRQSLCKIPLKKTFLCVTHAVFCYSAADSKTGLSIPKALFFVLFSQPMLRRSSYLSLCRVTTVSLFAL